MIKAYLGGNATSRKRRMVGFGSIDLFGDLYIQPVLHRWRDLDLLNDLGTHFINLHAVSDITEEARNCSL